MSYSTDPSAPSAILSKASQSVYVPKNGSYVDSIEIQFDGIASCHFYAQGSDGQITVADDCEVSAAVYADPD